MNNHNNVNYFERSALTVGQRLVCRTHRNEVYEVVSIEPEISGVTLARALLRQIRKPGARRRAKTDLIAISHLEESYERVDRQSISGACR